MEIDQKVFKLTSVLLEYPSKDLLSALPNLRTVVEHIPDTMIKKRFNAFFDYVKHTEFNQLCENYVYTFDYHGIASLHLTYRVFKDSRKRGEALVKLRQLFQEANLENPVDELPDFLPLILEFLSIANDDQAHQLLKLHQQAIKKLYEDLKEEKSIYHVLIENIQTIAKARLANEEVS